MEHRKDLVFSSLEKGEGNLSSSLDLRLSTCSVGDISVCPCLLLVCVLAVASWRLDRGQELLLPCASEESLRPGRPKFKSLSASSWLESVGVLRVLPHSVFLSAQKA